MEYSATASFILDALEQAIHARRPGPDDGMIHHSDRGVQYLAMNYIQRLAEANLNPSVGSVGDSHDNAVAETINGLYGSSLRVQAPSGSIFGMPTGAMPVCGSTISCSARRRRVGWPMPRSMPCSRLGKG